MHASVNGRLLAVGTAAVRSTPHYVMNVPLVDTFIVHRVVSSRANSTHFNLSWICMTNPQQVVQHVDVSRCCSRSPQQIEVVESELLSFYGLS